MARHRAPDVASPLHGVSPTGSGRPRHAAGPALRVHTPERSGRHRGPARPNERAGSSLLAGGHRAATALELVGPVVVERPAQAPRPVAIEVVPTPFLLTLVAAPESGPTPAPVRPMAPPQPLAETITWAGFACLVSCGVVAAGQGPREEALWLLGIGGGALSTVGLGLLGLRRLRRGRAETTPQ